MSDTPTPSVQEPIKKNTPEDNLSTINSLYEEIQTLKSENNKLIEKLYTYRAAAGIHGGDSDEEIKNKLRVLNSFRICGLADPTRIKSLNELAAMKEVPYLIENCSVEQLEFMVETVSIVVAQVAAHLKGSPIIKIRREQKQREAKEASDRAKADNESKSPKAKAEKRQQLSENKAEDKAIRMLMKSGISESEAKKMVASMKGHNS